MSLLTNYANTAFASASSVIGTNQLSIAGGSSISAVKNSVRHNRDFDDGGFAPGSAIDLVVAKSVFAAAYASAANAYVGNTATFENATYRVTDIDVGAHAVTVRLAHQEFAT